MKTSAADVYYNDVLAGRLERTGPGFSFRYTAEYLTTAHPPVSLTLPKQKAPFVSAVLFAFFYGLLAEGVAKDVQCRELHLAENDHFTRLLRTAHTETIGAVTVRAVAETMSS